MTTYPNNWHVRPNTCDCHPETCCCNDHAIHSPSGEKVTTFFHETEAQDFADLKNQIMTAAGEKRDTLLDHLENLDKAIESTLAQPETPTEFSGFGDAKTEEPSSQMIAATITLPNSIVVLNTNCETKEEGIDWFIQLMGSQGNALTATNIMDNPVLIPKNLIEYVEISDYNEMKEFDKEMRERYAPGPIQHVKPTPEGYAEVPKKDETCQ